MLWEMNIFVYICLAFELHMLTMWLWWDKLWVCFDCSSTAGLGRLEHLAAGQFNTITINHQGSVEYCWRWAVGAGEGTEGGDSQYLAIYICSGEGSMSELLLQLLRLTFHITGIAWRTQPPASSHKQTCYKAQTLHTHIKRGTVCPWEGVCDCLYLVTWA